MYYLISSKSIWSSFETLEEASKILRNLRHVLVMAWTLWHLRNLACHAGLDPASFSKKISDRERPRCPNPVPGRAARGDNEQSYIHSQRDVLFQLIGWMTSRFWRNLLVMAWTLWHLRNLACHAGLDPASFSKKISVRERPQDPESSPGQAGPGWQQRELQSAVFKWGP